MAMPVYHLFFAKIHTQACPNYWGNYSYKSVVGILLLADTLHSGATKPPSPKRPKICLSEDTTTGRCHDPMWFLGKSRGQSTLRLLASEHLAIV